LVVVQYGVQNFFADEFVAHHAEGIDRWRQTISLVVEDAYKGLPFLRYPPELSRELPEP
jgi:hypothetical protein